jgi:hypothetical protein
MDAVMPSRLKPILLGNLVLVCACLVLPLAAQRPEVQAPTTETVVATYDLRNWLSVIAADAMQGREIFSEGAGIASAYIADQLRTFGVEPAGDDGSYFQTVRVLGISNRGTSSVTVTVGGRSRTFRDGEGVRFQKEQGVKRVLSAEAVFVGYGLDFSPLNHRDYEGREVSGKIAVYLGTSPQQFSEAQNGLVRNRAFDAVGNHGAVGSIGPLPVDSDQGAQNRGAGRGDQADFQTSQRLDAVEAPRLSAGDDFLAFLFSASGYDYADLKARAGRRESLPRVNLGGVRLRFDIEPEYQTVQTRLSRNIVGRVRGSDPVLRDTYLLYGAHYDHVGYASRGGQPLPDVSGMCPGLRRTPSPPTDIIFNGADDDGSGTVALMALAKAFAAGTPPRRSILFVWHTGEEAGLYGSQYMADYPVVPMAAVSAQLNIDMIGRHKCDDAAESNTLYLVGSDRISTELHQLNEAANASLASPLTLDYTLNDPADLEALYTRSDHFSYAAKGIPIIFFTTGLHADYHAVTDEIEKIDFEKMARITRLIHETGRRLANLDHMPLRDNKGPRSMRRPAP